VAALGSDVPYKVTYEGEWIRVIELFTPRRNPDPASPNYYRAVIVWELGRTIDIQLIHFNHITTMGLTRDVRNVFMAEDEKRLDTFYRIYWRRTLETFLALDEDQAKKALSFSRGCEFLQTISQVQQDIRDEWDRSSLIFSTAHFRINVENTLIIVSDANPSIYRLWSFDLRRLDFNCLSLIRPFMMAVDEHKRICKTALKWTHLMRLDLLALVE